MRIIAVLLLPLSLFGQVHLNWNPNPETNIAGYKVYRSTVSQQYGTALTSLLTFNAFTDTAVQSGIRYFYVVTAINTAGVESAFSNEVSTTIPPTTQVDKTAPTIRFLTPSGATFSSNNVTVRVVASDNVRVVRVELFRAGHQTPIAVSGELSMPNGTIYLHWQALVIPSGAYVLTAYAYDVAGNKSLPATTTVIRR